MGIILANAQAPEHTLMLRHSSLRGIIIALIISGILSSCSSPTHSQTSISKKAEKYYTEGSEHLNWDRFKEAETAFAEAVKIQPDYVAALEKLGFTYSRLLQYEKAYQTFSKLVPLKPKSIREVELALAKLCLATHRFDEGLEHLKQFASSGAPSPADQEFAKRLESNLLFAKGYLKKFPPNEKSAVQPLNASINTAEREYFPTLTADGDRLFFTRHVRGPGNVINEDIFYSKWNGSDWSVPRGVAANVNSQYNEAAASVSPDGRRLYLTICEQPYNIGGCDIWVTYKLGDTWSDPENIGQPVNTQFKETQPCLSGDGRSLYFCSNRKGGQGGIDIWVCHQLENGKWSEPENLGAPVNTPYDESRPFMHPDNHTLYFSSAGHPGFGNADIFMAKKDSAGKWQTPVNVGLPINSYENDEGIFVSADGTTGYFASDRFNISEKGEDNFDIYSFSLRREIAPNTVAFVKGIVTDESNNKIAARIDFIELETKVTVNTTLSDSKNGEYLLCLEAGKDYAMSISKEGYLFFSENFSLKNLKPGENFTLDAHLKKIKAGEKTVLKNIFFEFNSSELKKQSIAELEILAGFLRKNASVKIEIEGHTDNAGKPEYNQALSEQRAKSVYDFLVSSGIAQNRLSFKGFGELQPVADNATEDGRAKNRRTEFRIVSE